MKKVTILALVLCFALVASLAACGGGGTSESTVTSPSEQAGTSESATEGAEGPAAEALAGDTVDTTSFKKDDIADDLSNVVVGFSNINVSQTWRQQMVAELEYHAKDLGVTLYSVDAGDDQSKQISDIQDLMTRGIDALLVAPGSTTATNAVTKQAISRGIPVIIINSEVDDPDAYTGFVGSNNVDYGYECGKWLLNELGGEGNIIVLNGMAGHATSSLREDGLKKAIAELPDGGERINILATYHADWAYDKGKQAAEQALAAYPDIDGVWSQGGAMSQGAIEAFQAAGRELVPITGEDNNGFLKMWKTLKDQGKFASIAAADPTYQSAVALDMAISALRGEPIVKMNYLPTPTITDDNLDEYVRMEYSDAYWNNTWLSKEVLDQIYLSN